MTDLKGRLAADLKTAMKEKDKVRKDVIQLIRAGIQQVEKDEQVILDDSGAEKVVQKELKKRQETIAELRGQRPETIAELEHEIELIQSYLPEQLSEEALNRLIDEAIAEVGATSMKDMGQVMKVLMPKVGTQADGKTVNLRLREKLN